MVDEKITEFDEDTAPVAADLLATVDDVAGIPITKKATIANVVGYVVSTVGDIMYATGSRTLARLGVGTAGQVLATDSGATAPEWTSAPSALIGKKTVYIPASAMTPTVTNGCATLVTTETTALRPDMSALAFADGGTVLHTQFSFSFPKAWDAGVITYQVFWTGLVAGAGGVKWGLQAVATADNDTINVATGTIIEIVDTFLVAEDMHVSPVSANLTIAGTPGDNEMIFFDLQRDPTDGSDTRAQDANLLGVKILYTVDTLKDD